MIEQNLARLDAVATACDRLWLSAYDEGVSRTFAQTHATIKEAMLAHLEKGSSQPLIFYKDARITRAQADEEACRLANGLTQAGIRKSDRVNIVVSNRPEAVVAFMACYKAGFVAAAFNQRCTAREITQSVACVSSTALIVERDTLPKVLPAIEAGELPSLKAVIVVDGEGLDLPPAAGSASVCPYVRVLAGADPVEPSAKISADDDAILLFTGGTTGVSKGCCQTHGAMVWELQAMRHWVSSALATPDPSILVCMPMTHIMGINYGVNWQLINGGSVVIAEGHKPLDIIRSLERYRPTVWATLPTLLHSVSKDEALPISPYRDLELVIFGGSFVAREMLEDMIAKTSARFVESYGMSESFGFVTCNPVGSMGKVGSIGLPISDTDVLVVDLEESTKVLVPGERGEIVFRGPQIIREYWANPEETKHALRDGWLYSGDIGYMDEDGFFYLVDRKKDTIVVSGFNVFPSEIDEVLMSHPLILDACTIGVPDEHSGERPKSFIVTADGAEIDAQEIDLFCRERLVAYKIPKYLEAISEIPKTKAKKPARAFLRQEEERKAAGRHGESR